MTEQMSRAEQAQKEYYDRELRAAAQAMEAEARRIVNELKEDMRESMKTLLGG